MTSDDEMRRLAEAVAGDPWDRMAAADVAFNRAAREKVPELLDRVAFLEAEIDTAHRDWEEVATALQERAVKAEAEVEKLRAEVKALDAMSDEQDSDFRAVLDSRARFKAERDELRARLERVRVLANLLHLDPEDAEWRSLIRAKTGYEEAE